MDRTAPFLVNCSIMFTDLPLLQRPAAAKAAGFEAIEFWWPFARSVPSDRDVDAFTAAVLNSGTRAVFLNLAAGDMAAGDRGLVSWPGRETEFADSIASAVGIGARLGIQGFNALYGNTIVGAAPGEQRRLASQNLRLVAAQAATIGAGVLLEPLSGQPRYPLTRVADVLAVMDTIAAESGMTNLQMLADLYHLSVNGEDLAAMIDQHTRRIGHVQLADAPGRHEPGTGTIPFRDHLNALWQNGYSGWISLEYAPSGPTVDSFDWVDRLPRSVLATGTSSG